MGYVIIKRHAPVALEQPSNGTIGSLAFLSLWSVVAFNMSNFQLGSSLLSVGLNWWQSVVATLFGHIFAALLIIVISFPGLYYHISFPLSQRMTWGEIHALPNAKTS